MAFEEIKAKLGLDITDYERALVRSVEQAKQAQKDINAARLAQARETNRSITADQNKPAKSARESASVFEQAMAAEEEAKKKTLQNEQEIVDTKQRNIEQEERRRLKSTDKLARISKTIAAALGINLQEISESIARLIVGFSKIQEDALNRLVQSSREAADQLSGIALERQGGNDPEKRIKLLDRELASVRLQAQARTKLTAAEKYAILAREGPIMADAKIASIEESMAMGVEEANKRIGQISRERLIAEGELKKKNADKERKNIEEIGKSFAASDDERNKRKFNELSIDGKIASKQADLANAQKIANDETKDAVQRAQAVAKSQQLIFEIIDLQSERTKGIADADNKRASVEREISNIKEETAKIGKTDSEILIDLENKLTQLKKSGNDITDEDKRLQNTLEIAKTEQQIKKYKQDAAKASSDLKKQAVTKETDLSNSRRQADLPTMAEVISGKRNIGTVGKTRATTLERARAKELQLSDAEQRAREAYANAPTESAKAAALAQGRGIRSKLDMTRTQIKGLENILGHRIKDANPYSIMIEELGKIYNQLDKLNITTLAPTSIK